MRACKRYRNYTARTTIEILALLLQCKYNTYFIII